MRQSLIQLTNEAEQTVSELEMLRAKLDLYKQITRRTTWAVKDSRGVKRQLTKVQTVETSVSKWLEIIPLYVARICCSSQR